MLDCKVWQLNTGARCQEMKGLTRCKCLLQGIRPWQLWRGAGSFTSPRCGDLTPPLQRLAQGAHAASEYRRVVPPDGVGEVRRTRHLALPLFHEDSHCRTSSGLKRANSSSLRSSKNWMRASWTKAVERRGDEASASSSSRCCSSLRPPSTVRGCSGRRHRRAERFRQAPAGNGPVPGPQVEESSQSASWIPLGPQRYSP